TAAEHGFDPQDVHRILQGKTRSLEPKEAHKVLDRAINEGVARLTAQEAHFSRYGLIAEVLNATVDQHIKPDLALSRIDETLREERFMALGDWKNQERFTTRDIYQKLEEKALLAVKEMGERTTKRPFSDRIIQQEIERSPKELNPGQEKAVRLICDGKGGDITFV